MVSPGERHDRIRFANPAVRHRLRVMERDILARVRDSQLILDLGCGTGRFTCQLVAGRVIGLDRSRSMLEVARRRGVCSVLSDAHALPFQAETFDAIVSTDQVFNCLEQDTALRECHRVLKPQGLLAMQIGTDMIWTPRAPLRLTSRPGARGKSGAALIEAARGIGFECDSVRLWRWLRWYPYLFSVPSRPRLRVWNQGIMLFHKRGLTAA